MSLGKKSREEITAEWNKWDVYTVLDYAMAAMLILVVMTSVGLPKPKPITHKISKVPIADGLLPKCKITSASTQIPRDERRICKELKEHRVQPETRDNPSYLEFSKRENILNALRISAASDTKGMAQNMLSSTSGVEHRNLSTFITLLEMLGASRKQINM